MSRSVNTERTPNPAKKFFQWDSDSKGFKFYDKEAPHKTDKTKKGANVLVPIPFQFLVLDTLHTITGFSDADGTGIYSNEVRDLKKQALNIRIGKNTAAVGLYEDVKGKVVGAKYATSIYIAYFETGADGKKYLEIGNLKVTGASLGPWIDFTKAHKVTEGAIKVMSTVEGKKGKVTWDSPVFEAITVKPETDAKAVELDTVLQAYLKEYFEANATAEVTAIPTAAEVEATFDKPKTPATDALFTSEMNAPVTSGFPDDEDF